MLGGCIGTSINASTRTSPTLESIPGELAEDNLSRNTAPRLTGRFLTRLEAIGLAGYSHLAVGTVVLFVALIRWRLLRDTPYPTGLDGGNWLAYGHALLGEHIRSASLVAPPIVPLLAVLGEKSFGTFDGIKVLAIASSAAPPIGLYALLYSWGFRLRAAALAGFLAASAGTGEAMAWGGYPQLIGLGLLPVVILALDRFLTSRRAISAIPVATLMAAALAASTLVGPITVVVALLYLPFRYVVLRTSGVSKDLRQIVIGTLLAATLAIPVAPIYLGLLPGVLANEHAKHSAAGSMWAVISGAQAPINDLPIFWLVGLVAAVTVPLTLSRERHPLALSTMAVLVPTLALLVITGDNRFAYFFPLAIVLGIATWWEAFSNAAPVARNLMAAALSCFLAVDVLVGTSYFAIQRNYYIVLTPELVQSFDVLGARSQSTELIAISPVQRDWELGWWVEGVVRRRTLYAGNPVWLNYPDERERNKEANQIFSLTNDFQDSLAIARRYGVSYLLVDKAWAGYAIWSQSIRQTDVIYDNAAVVIIATDGSEA